MQSFIVEASADRRGADPQRTIRRLRWAAAGSFVATAAFAILITFSWGVLTPGRGSERATGANVVGPALLLLSLAHAGQASGFRVVQRNPWASRSTAIVSYGAALTLAILGALLLFDRYPCTSGLYCSGQVLGTLGQAAFYLWFLVPMVANLLLGIFILPEMVLRNRSAFSAAAIFLLVDACLFGFLFAGVAVLLFWFASFAVGAAANGVMGGAFLAEADGTAAGSSTTIAAVPANPPEGGRIV